MVCKFLVLTALVSSVSLMLTNVAASQTKDDFVFIDDKQYFIATENKLTWWQAMEACEFFGMRLVSFPTVEAYNTINNFMATYETVPSPMWSSAIRFSSGYLWSARGGQAVNVEWAAGEPSTNQVENCVANVADVGMGNYICDTAMSYMCEHHCIF